MTDPEPLKTLLQAIAEADSASSMVAAVEKLAQTHLEAAVPHLITVLGYKRL
jgi:hypothetical protein